MEFLKKYVMLVVMAAALFFALIFYLMNITNKNQANVVERGALKLFAPVMKPVSRTGIFLNDTWNGYINLVNVQRDNQRMVEQIRELNARINEGNEAVQANLRLKKLLEMKATVKPPTITASIVGEDFSSWYRTLVIDRGSSSGLKEGMAVLAADGVVGQIVKVAPESARVLLLTDHASGIAATIQRSRARGVVKGKGEGLCSLEFTTREEDVKVGDMVVTSGVGGVFLKGLPIGEVTMVKRGEYGIFQTVTIRPAVTTAHLEEVLVVLRGGYE